MEISFFIRTSLVLVFLTFVLIKERSFKFFHPVILVLVVSFIQYCLPAIYTLSNEDVFPYLSSSAQSLSRGLDFVNVTVLLLIGGFYSPDYSKRMKNLLVTILKKIPNVNNYHIQINNLSFLIFVLFAIGWAARIFLINIGAYYLVEVSYRKSLPEYITIFAQYLYIASLFPYIALILTFFEWLKKTEKLHYLLISILMLVLNVLYALPSGSKERVFAPLFLLIAIYSLKKKFPFIVLILFVLFFTFFVFPFVGIYRNLLLTGDVIKDTTLAVNIYLNLISHIDKYFFDSLFYYLFGVRFNNIIQIATLIDVMQKQDYIYGYSYFLFLISLIPRLFWHNKPDISSFGNQYGRDYGFLDANDFSTCVNVPWIAEMYMNFSWSGIIIGFIYGFIYRLVYSYFLERGKISTLAAILYVVNLYYMSTGEIMFATQFSGILKISLVVVLVFLPFIKRNKSA